ncbi:MAG: hypothetical protein H0T89_11090 [Deltaproteobacteria bacterium]|nr:hypothetical protein [Deltaproteobacteria bacterium]MDQ3296330.1 hypothetical protein [Myxococcota bacterium]
MPASFFEMFFDNDYKQRSDINDAYAEAANARFATSLAMSNLEQLGKQLLVQRDEIRDLTVAVSVLVKMLAESGALDDKVLRYRVEAELEERIEAAKAAQVRQSVAAAPAELADVTCSKCLQRRDPGQTVMTGNGVVCDPSCEALR